MNSNYKCQWWFNFCSFKTICVIINHDTAYHKINICAHLKLRSACTSVQSERGFCCALYGHLSLFIGLVKTNNQTVWLRIKVLFRRTYTECNARFMFIYLHICVTARSPPLVGEHAFPLMGFVCWSVHVTFGGSGGIRSTARPELPYPCVSQAKSRDETSRRGM